MPDHTSSIFLSPFAWGLYLGLVFAVLAFYNFLRKKWEHSSYKKHVAEMRETEARTITNIRGETETLRKENENLRLKINQQNQAPDYRHERELEILARAEKQMTLNAPGFAQAWENAKRAALTELQAEEAGKSFPNRVLKFFGGGSSTPEKSLPANDEKQRGGE